MMKANDVIRIGRKRRRAASAAASLIECAVGAPFARELDDQHRVLGRQPNEHDDADLHVDVVVEPPKQRRKQTRRKCRSARQEHRQRHQPALVLRGEREKDEQHREDEDDRLRVADRDFLIGGARPAVRVAGRKRLLRDVLHRGDRLTRAIAGRVRAEDLDLAVRVETLDEIGSDARAASSSRALNGTISPVLLRT